MPLNHFSYYRRSHAAINNVDANNSVVNFFILTPHYRNSIIPIDMPSFVLSHTPKCQDNT